MRVNCVVVFILAVGPGETAVEALPSLWEIGAEGRGETSPPWRSIERVPQPMLEIQGHWGVRDDPVGRGSWRRACKEAILGHTAW